MLTIGDKPTAPQMNAIPAIGSISMFAHSTIPTGWLLCDGSAVNRTTYADLFALIGTTYGAGDTTTTFNLPDLKGKIPVGYNASETEFDNIGETGGEKTHTITEAEMASHSHTFTATDANLDGGSLGSNGSSDGTHNTSSSGSGSAHNNLQPYITVNFIIKYG
jgi:microcystin-dependent protein